MQLKDPVYKNLCTQFIILSTVAAVVLDDTAITSRRCDVRRRRYLLEVLAIISEFKGHEQAPARTERGQLL